MVDLYIPKTKYTPEIRFSVSGVFIIKGISLVEDSHNLYAGAMDWIKEFSERPPQPVALTLRFDHLDTSSVRAVVDLVKLLTILIEKGFEVDVKWYYESADDDLYEIGEAIQSICAVSFSLVEIDINDLEV